MVLQTKNNVEPNIGSLQVDIKPKPVEIESKIENVFDSDLLSRSLDEKMDRLEGISPSDFIQYVDKYVKNSEVSEISTLSGILFSDPLRLGKIELSKNEARKLWGNLKYGMDEVSLKQGKVKIERKAVKIKEEYNPQLQNTEIYITREINDSVSTKGRIIGLKDASDKLEWYSKLSSQNENAINVAWEELMSTYVLISDRELVPLLSIFQESVYSYPKLDENGRKEINLIKEKYEIGEDFYEGLDEFYEELLEKNLLKPYVRHLFENKRTIEDEFGIPLPTEQDLKYKRYEGYVPNKRRRLFEALFIGGILTLGCLPFSACISQEEDEKTPEYTETPEETPEPTVAPPTETPEYTETPEELPEYSETPEPTVAPTETPEKPEIEVIEYDLNNDGVVDIVDRGGFEDSECIIINGCDQCPRPGIKRHYTYYDSRELIIGGNPYNIIGDGISTNADGDMVKTLLLSTDEDLYSEIAISSGSNTNYLLGVYLGSHGCGTDANAFIKFNKFNGDERFEFDDFYKDIKNNGLPNMTKEEAREEYDEICNIVEYLIKELDIFNHPEYWKHHEKGLKENQLYIF